MPLVDRFKFVTKGRWLTQICERYAKNKTNDLQLAFFNGDVSSKATPPPPQLVMRARPQGFEAWENVWGTWNGESTDALRFTVSWSTRLSHGRRSRSQG